MRTIEVLDTTLRDGEQAPSNNMNPEQKLKIALALEKLNVDIIEAGFPASNREDFEACRSIAQNIVNAKIGALARCLDEDISKAYDALECSSAPVIHLFYATSELHLQKKYRVTRNDAVQKIQYSIDLAAQHFPEVIFSAEDGSRTSTEDLIYFFGAAIEAGAQTLGIADTVGIWRPNEAYATFREVAQEFPRTKIGFHAHNDRGLATANTLEAIRAGASQIQGTINGIGERAGNCSIAEVCFNLLLDGSYQSTTNVDMRKIRSASDLAYDILQRDVPMEGAVIGANLARHAAGIHQDGTLKDPLCYLGFDPALLCARHEFVRTKHSSNKIRL